MSACTNCPYPDECGDRRACQRRAGAIEPVAMLPLSFEPAETLGDTYPAPLDEPPSVTLAREARWTNVMYAVVLGSLGAMYFGWLA